MAELKDENKYNGKNINLKIPFKGKLVKAR